MGTTSTTTLTAIPTTATIRPWIDPVVDEHGHDPRSAYVEQFWLGVIGPTATWLMRRFVAGFDAEPSGYRLDLEHTATAMGLSLGKGMASPFARAVQRCVMFGLMHPLSDGFAVRRRLPPIGQRHLSRLPEDLRTAHASWEQATVRLAARDLEEYLIAAGVPPRTAVTAADFVLRAS